MTRILTRGCYDLKVIPSLTTPHPTYTNHATQPHHVPSYAAGARCVNTCALRHGCMRMPSSRDARLRRSSDDPGAVRRRRRAF